MKILRTAADIDFSLQDLPRVPLADQVLMVDPADFDVLYAINPHMLDEDGNLLSVDRHEARRQWWCLREAIEDLGVHVDVAPPLEGFPDIVFCANQALPISNAITGGHSIAIASNMASEERAGEVPHIISYLRELGYQPGALKARDVHLEGMGDGLFHPGRKLLWAGVGPRSEEAAWLELSTRFDLTVALLPLADPDFYHLDTALAMLSEDACLWYPDALTKEARELVEALVPTRIEAPEDEARKLFACNAFSPDCETVLINQGCNVTNDRLETAGFRVQELNTSEFVKAGGSVFCMKLQHGPC
ncbi:MAG: amidinotransferase [Planctomycetota bacterium]|nr:amidinotransferase [Planctomycetota bacterium]